MKLIKLEREIETENFVITKATFKRFWGGKTTRKCKTIKAPKGFLYNYGSTSFFDTGRPVNHGLMDRSFETFLESGKESMEF